MKFAEKLEDIPQAGENDPDAIDPFKFGRWFLLAVVFIIILALIGWPS